jgi:hypothetical protein
VFKKVSVIVGRPGVRFRELVAELRVPAEAARTGCLISPKCRVESAMVVRLFELNGSEVSDPQIKAASGGGSARVIPLTYAVGKEVRCHKAFDPDIRRACTSGIHCFATFEQARDYDWS